MLETEEKAKTLAAAKAIQFSEKASGEMTCMLSSAKKGGKRFKGRIEIDNASSSVMVNNGIKKAKAQRRESANPKLWPWETATMGRRPRRRYR